MEVAGSDADTSLTIRQATLQDVPLIRRVAKSAWPAFGEILSPDFLQYELNRVYNSDAIKRLLNEGETFLIAEAAEGVLGFASYRISDKVGKLEKLYLAPELKGKGYGKRLLLEVLERVAQAQACALLLNVNRANPAIGFYERMGFKIVREEDIEVGQGLFRRDYVMSRTLSGTSGVGPY